MDESIEATFFLNRYFTFSRACKRVFCCYEEKEKIRQGAWCEVQTSSDVMHRFYLPYLKFRGRC